MAATLRTISYPRPAIDTLLAAKASIASLSAHTSDHNNPHVVTVGQLSGFLDGNGKIVTTFLPPLAIGETFTPASQVAMLALTAQRGDVAVRTDQNKTYRLTADDPTQLANWQEILVSGESPVQSVNGHVGTVTTQISPVEGHLGVWDSAGRFVDSFVVTSVSSASGNPSLDPVDFHPTGYTFDNPDAPIYIIDWQAMDFQIQSLSAETIGASHINGPLKTTTQAINLAEYTTGTSDDTTAVQNAVNAAIAAPHRTLFAPAATYKVGKITIASRIRIVGDGFDPTRAAGRPNIANGPKTVFESLAGDTVFDFTGGADFSGTELENFKILGVRTGGTINGDGIYFNPTSENHSIRIRNVYAWDTSGHGFHFGPTVATWDVRMDDTKTDHTFKHGYYFENLGTVSTFTNVLWHRPGAGYVGFAVYGGSGTQATLINCGGGDNLDAVYGGGVIVGDGCRVIAYNLHLERWHGVGLQIGHSTGGCVVTLIQPLFDDASSSVGPNAQTAIRWVNGGTTQLFPTIIISPLFNTNSAWLNGHPMTYGGARLNAVMLATRGPTYDPYQAYEEGSGSPGFIVDLPIGSTRTDLALDSTDQIQDARSVQYVDRLYAGSIKASKRITGGIVTLATASDAIDARNGTNVTASTAADFTLALPSNGANLDRLFFAIKNTAVSDKTMTLATGWRKDDGTLTVTLKAGKWEYFGGVCNTADSKWDFAAAPSATGF
jgi:hypothetical protein